MPTDNKIYNSWPWPLFRVNKTSSSKKYLECRNKTESIFIIVNHKIITRNVRRNIIVELLYISGK
jgi:hypothetical protein